MCGLTGFLFRDPAGSPDAVVASMVEALTHRGPDDAGVLVDAAAGVALGHRRLAVVDLSPQGHQPMLSESGRYVIAYNGEVYNFRELRRELMAEGHGFRGHSDTEVILAAVEAWGLEQSLGRFVGMFAFALWDREQRRLHLARDRVGEKPLYYGWMGGAFLFGSELKALRRHPAWRGTVDPNAVALMLRHNYVPSPYSIYREVRKLPAGTHLTVDPAAPGTLPAPVVYWSARAVAERGARAPFSGPDAEAADRLEALLRQTLRGQMIADVPLGAFLSGGIDSSTVAALMQAESTRPVKTFTIGFHETDFDEAPHARAVARHLGTEHTELYLSPGEALSVIPTLPELYDEPFSDVSQIPTFLLARMAREHVTVSLSGDGGDELFGGYTRYAIARDTWNRIRRLPPSVRHALSGALGRLPEERWNTLFGWAAPLFSRYGQASIGDKLHAASRLLTAESLNTVYRRLVSHWPDPERVVRGAVEPPTVLTDPDRWAELAGDTERMMFWDTVSYLPDDILVKVDRASMGVSLEAREPLLDHRVLAFVWSLPMHMKVRHGTAKWLLRQVLYRHVPPQLVERPKMGFGVPIGQWLRGPLREWAESLLEERRLREEGFLDPGRVRTTWAQHLSGARNWQYLLWDVLMFQAWLEAEGRTASRPE